MSTHNIQFYDKIRNFLKKLSVEFRRDSNNEFELVIVSVRPIEARLYISELSSNTPL